MDIKLYDTLARDKRVFTPADPARITLYVCGPTVYNRAHIGNARPAVVFDVLARLLRHVYGETSLVYARNVTDVDDKINAAARAEGVDISVITRRYEDFYLADMGALGVAPPTIAPRATEHIGAMTAMIERLIAGGHAYAAEGHVLFHVPSDPDYGALSRRTREAMQAGARVEIAPFKRDPADFVLWKPSTEDQPGWDSPWGRGRPGWHIECSAMIEQHLGDTIDIHAGGQDLIFPHHENEIAQSRCVHQGAPLARYWLHNGFLSMDKEKMSKSLGNVVTVAELLEQGWDGETIRLALLSAHYRQPLDWNETLLERSKATLDRWYRRVEDQAGAAEPDAGVLEALADDLNTPLAITRLSAIEDAAVLRASARLLGLMNQTTDERFRGKYRLQVEAGHIAVEGGAVTFRISRSSNEIDAAIAARAEAKKARNFAEADRIRDALAAEGVILEDGPGGTSWRRA